MPPEESEVTVKDMADNKLPQNDAPAPNAPMSNQVSQNLTEALNLMRRELITFHQANDKAAKNEVNNNPESDGNNNKKSMRFAPLPPGYY